MPVVWIVPLALGLAAVGFPFLRRVTRRPAFASCLSTGAVSAFGGLALI